MILNEKVQAKWNPILEHEDLPKIDDNYRKSVTAILLENQEKMMREQAAQSRGTGLFLTEAPMGSAMTAGGTVNNTDTPATGSIEFVDPVLISLVRRTMPRLLAYDICGVQPLTSPTGLIFAMRSQFGSPATLASAGANTVNEAFYTEANTAHSSVGTGNHAPGDPADPLEMYFETTANTALSNVTGTGMGTNFGENLGLGANAAIPEMSFSIEKVTVTAESRKLRGQYTLEMAQDLKATHGLNAEAELANILSNEILAEVNRQVLRTIYFNAKVGAQNTTTAGEFDLLVDSNGRWSVEKFKGLMFQLEVEANKIARETRRGKGNVIICSADIASALNMAGVLDNATNLKNNINSDETGELFAGVLNGQFKVYIDPYLPVNAKSMVVVGYKGSSPYDNGIFYSNYVPLQMMKAQDPNTFHPIIGFMTRDAIVANPFSQGIKRISGAGLDKNANVYYRKMKVSNLS